MHWVSKELDTDDENATSLARQAWMRLSIAAIISDGDAEWRARP
jgi:hypothetical protein